MFFKFLMSSIVVILGFGPYVFGSCDFNVIKTMMPLAHLENHKSLCADEYFELRDIGFYSQVESDKGVVTVEEDFVELQFHDYLIFETSNGPLGLEGRLKLARLMYSHFLSSLKNEFGQCELQMSEGSQSLTIDDFEAVERSEAGQPGTRLILTKNSPTTSWKLSCPQASGENVVEKSGDYIFVFVDIYENINTNPKLEGHMAQFLFSLN